MVERPERQVEAFAKAGADVITVHPEATPHIHYALQKIREHGCRAGVVINPGTPVEAVEPVAEIVDLCLVMSVNPGWGGQRYIPTSTGRLARLRALLPPEVVLEVDGGIIARDDRRGARRRHRPLRRRLERLRRGRPGGGVPGAHARACQSVGVEVDVLLYRNRRRSI